MKVVLFTTSVVYFKKNDDNDDNDIQCKSMTGYECNYLSIKYIIKKNILKKKIIVITNE